MATETSAANTVISEKDLKAKYGNESIMVIPSERLPRFAVKPVFIPVTDKIAPILLEAERHFAISIPRYEAEASARYRQPIPYVLFEDMSMDTNSVLPSLWFNTKRLGGDVRLVGQLSAGIGGHVNEGETVGDALHREVMEETGCNITEMNCSFLGWIVSRMSLVDTMHIGYVFIYQGSQVPKIQELDTLTGMWMTAKEMRNHYDQFETWTQILLDNGVIV
jgi:predicted NUDIX family phosphoesterase